LIYIETLFIGESERYVKISAVEKGSSLHRGPVEGTREGRCFTEEFERKVRF
jgi:hypothetical protein